MSNLQQLYDNEAIFDRFQVKVSPDGKYLSTGSYNECFNVIDYYKSAKSYTIPTD